MCFGFFFLTACAMGGIQGFAGPSLVSLYGVTLASATTAYTAYMLASAAGMACGGFLAARAGNPDRTIAIAFLFAAALALLIAAGVLAPWMPVPLMGLIGFAAGVAGPSRDLLIRAAAPPNATGRVFGVVYSGLDCGLDLGPLAFGALMDAGRPAAVFLGIAVFQFLAIVTAVGLGGKGRAPVPQSA
jgi:MFS family permease